MLFLLGALLVSALNIPIAQAQEWALQVNDVVRPTKQQNGEIAAYYILEKSLGTPGSYGEAYLATPFDQGAKAKQPKVVLKYIKSDRFRQSSFDREWERLDATRGLKYVIQSSGRMRAKVERNQKSIGEGHFFVMAVYDGGDVFDFMEAIKKQYTAQKLTQQDVFKIGRQLSLHVATGLAELHKQNIIHRDMKPENILISCNPGETNCTCSDPASTCSPQSLKWTAHVADLGLSLKVDKTKASPGAKLHNSISGTPAYLPPELYVLPPLPSFDSFSLGLTLNDFFFFTIGCGYSRRSIADGFTKDDIPWYRQRGFCPSELYDALLLLTHKKPKNRTPPAGLLETAFLKSDTFQWPDRHYCYCYSKFDKARQNQCIEILEEPGATRIDFCKRYAASKHWAISGRRGPSEKRCTRRLKYLLMCPPKQ